MRVALLRDMPQENWRSMEVYADRLAMSLRALDASVQVVEVQVPAWSWPVLRVPTLYRRPASLRTLGLYLSRWLRYPLALRGVRADIYHILDNSYGHLAYFLDPRRTLVTTHGGTPHAYRRWNPEGPAMWIFDLAFRGMLRASRIAAVSECARQELLQEARYPADRVHVVYPGLDPVFQPQTASVRAEQRTSLLQARENYLLLHVGHSAARKNVKALYRALHLLRKDGWPVRLLRIGGAPPSAHLLAELNIAGAVSHIPYLANRELPAYYAAADALVLPSLYENLGLPLLEAMACGTPVVCSDLAVFREVCANAARFADPHRPEALVEAIVEVLAQGNLAQDLRQRGLERVQQFSWERSAQAMLEIYRQMMEGATLCP